jgi:hypothetical protein
VNDIELDKQYPRTNTLNLWFPNFIPGNEVSFNEYALCRNCYIQYIWKPALPNDIEKRAKAKHVTYKYKLVRLKEKS